MDIDVFGHVILDRPVEDRRIDLFAHFFDFDVADFLCFGLSFYEYHVRQRWFHPMGDIHVIEPDTTESMAGILGPAEIDLAASFSDELTPPSFIHRDSVDG